MRQTETELVRRWVEQAVIGLGLCPFARDHWAAGRVRLVVTAAASQETLLEALRKEVVLLEQSDPTLIETTLLIVTKFLRDFGDYNQFLSTIDDFGASHGWPGHFQVASFHPDYQFAGTDACDPQNLTNRSPYPLLHILRESTVTEAIQEHPNPEQIPIINIKTLRGLSDERRQAIFGRRGMT